MLNWTNEYVKTLGKTPFLSTCTSRTRTFHLSPLIFLDIFTFKLALPNHLSILFFVPCLRVLVHLDDTVVIYKNCGTMKLLSSTRKHSKITWNIITLCCVICVLHLSIRLTFPWPPKAMERSFPVILNLVLKSFINND